MYAIIEVGGKQYKVKKGDKLNVERQEKEEGKELVLNKVLLVADKSNIQLGTPYVKGVKVKAGVLKELKAAKVISHKYRRRKSWHWRKGHRQILTQIEIKEIETG